MAENNNPYLYEARPTGGGAGEGAFRLGGSGVSSNEKIQYFQF